MSPWSLIVAAALGLLASVGVPSGIGLGLAAAALVAVAWPGSGTHRLTPHS